MSRPRSPLLALILLGASCARGPSPLAERVLAPALTRIELQLGPLARTSLRAHPLAAEVQPELHVWDPGAQREVARATPGWLRTDAQLELHNASAHARRYELLITAHTPEHSGPVALYRDERVLEPHALAGGHALSLPSSGVAQYQAAAAAGGARRALLLGLRDNGELLDMDEHSGPTGLPKLAARPGMTRVLVASLEAGPQRLSVYANDPSDRDGDGLGRLLERALGTCDAPRDRACRHAPLARYYGTVANATRDSDRDGLPDADELFGVNASTLDLPRYGADPRHKDVLVELDHQDKLHDVGFTERELAEVASLFARGSASDLRNPDGRAGVHVCFDAGFAPTDPSHVALLGDFGGSGPSRAAEYRAARRKDFTPERAGYFRYAFSTRSGRGQATADALTVNRDLQRVSILAHELGHTLGLSHHGHDRWGKANCKPSYYSIMNYLYQARVELGFSRGSSPRQNPLHVLERAAAARGMGPLLADSPLELDVRGRDVDWNRDGLYSTEPVRAGLSWATFKSCGAGEHAKLTLADAAGSTHTPVLLGSGEQLHALWLDAAGALWVRSERHGDQAWTEAQQLTAAELEMNRRSNYFPSSGVLASAGGSTLSLRAFAVAEVAPQRLALAGVDERGAIALHLVDLRAAPVALPLSAADDAAFDAARAWDGPALAWGNVAESRYGAARALFLVARAADTGALTQWSMRPDRTGVRQRAVLDASGLPIRTGSAASLLELPTGELCGVFPDPEGFIRIYVYQPAHDTWLDLTASAFDAALGPRSSGPVGMAFHRFRAADGSPLNADATRGALYLSFTEPESAAARSPDNPHLYISEWLDAQHPARQQLHMRWRGRIITEWTNLAPGSGVALYEDERSDALEALLLEETREGRRLTFLPYADGAHDADLGGGSDFQVMERGICSVLRGESVCGGASTGAY